MRVLRHNRGARQLRGVRVEHTDRNAGTDGSDELAAELKQHVRHEVGPIAMPAVIEFVDSLPKTRSGKIMRRVLRARALGLPEGDLTTIEE